MDENPAQSEKTSSIRRFWERLDGSVHPDDKDVFNRNKHSFNLDFPPPAFIGNVDSALVIVLMANGGYDPNRTPTEFARREDILEYIDYLKGKRTQLPTSLSSYYTASSIGKWLAEEHVVLVNAIAYRSPKLSQEPWNIAVAEKLPSVAAHRRWLHNDVLPLAARGERLVVAHRHGMWKLPKHPSIPNILFSTNPISAHLSKAMIEKVTQWIDEHGLGR